MEDASCVPIVDAIDSRDIMTESEVIHVSSN